MFCLSFLQKFVKINISCFKAKFNLMFLSFNHQYIFLVDFYLTSNTGQNLSFLPFRLLNFLKVNPITNTALH